MKKTLTTSLLIVFCIASFSTPLLAQFTNEARLNYCATNLHIRLNNDLSESALAGSNVGNSIANCGEFPNEVLLDHYGSM